MWKRICESNEEVSENEIIEELGSVYQKLETIQHMLNGSSDIELRKKYIRPILDFMNWLDYEI